MFADALVELAEQNPELVGMTAAMLRPDGLAPFAERFPERVNDVGIAEQHAVDLRRRARVRRPAPGRRAVRDVHGPRVRPGADGRRRCTAPA